MKQEQKAESQITHSLRTKKNNFDIIRFFAAIMVIWFHSFPLTGTPNGQEFFTMISRGQTTAGAVAVIIFFLISGFLITMSYERSKTLVKYFKSRVLRIWPAYIVVILLSVFVIGPLLTNMSLKEYFTDPLARKYLLNVTLKSTYYDLPGVFTTNIYPNAVNGSICTLWYEFCFYIVVAVLGLTKLLKKEASLVFFAICFALVQLDPFPSYYYYYYCGFYFFAGMAFYLWRDKIKLNGKIAIIACLGLWLSLYVNQLPLALAICGGYLVFYLSLGDVPKFPNFSKYGDFSYGIYIYSFLIQQILMDIFNNHLDHWQNFLLATPLAIVAAFLSYHIIEKNAIKLKNINPE